MGAEEASIWSGIKAMDDEPETTKLKFFIDGRMAALKGMIEGMLASRPERGPDPDFSDNEREMRDLIFEAVRFGAQQGKGGPGSVNGDSNWKTIALWALGVLQALTLIVIGNFYTTFQQTHDDVVQIKCKLDPQCRIVVSSVK